MKNKTEKLEIMKWLYEEKKMLPTMFYSRGFYVENASKFVQGLGFPSKEEICPWFPLEQIFDLLEEYGYKCILEGDDKHLQALNMIKEVLSEEKKEKINEK